MIIAQSYLSWICIKYSLLQVDTFPFLAKNANAQGDKRDPKMIPIWWYVTQFSICLWSFIMLPCP